MCKTIRLNRDDRSSIRHALMHVEVNKMLEPQQYGNAWYCGNKEQFVARHKQTLALLRSLCEGKGASKGG
jgi:hypothetical protein